MYSTVQSVDRRRHDMSRRHVTGEDAVHSWKLAERTVNKLSRTADGGGPPAWALDVVLITLFIYHE